MAGRLIPCGGCQRHVRTTERSCPFCGAGLASSEPIEEWRLLNRLDRPRLFALGAVLSAAGIALGCREPVVAVYGAPPTPIPSSSAAPSVEPPAAAPLAPSVSASAAPSPPPPPPSPKPTAANPGTSAPGAPVAVYGAPPRRDRGSGL